MTDLAVSTVAVEGGVRIAASPATVWSVWTERERVVEWWGVDAEVVAEPGGLFHVTMDSGPSCGARLPSSIRHLGWSLVTAGRATPPEAARTGVDSRRGYVDHRRDGTLLLLPPHHDLPSSHAADHQKGWDLFAGERLAAIASQT